MLDMIMRPELVGRSFGGFPQIAFEWRDVRGKNRLIGIPNRPMRRLHQAFGTYLRSLAQAADGAGYGIRKLPSATGCVSGSNPLQNIKRHEGGRCFYITDLVDAYANVSLERLARLITFLIQYDLYIDELLLARFGEDDRTERLERDPLYRPVLSFLQIHFGGQYGRGLAVGGPLSPYLMNLYCEVYLDAPLRRFCERREEGSKITYTRYVDDLVFSSPSFFGAGTRRHIRAIITKSGFAVNHQKSRVNLLTMGQVSITKLGLELVREAHYPKTRIVFSQAKRKKLHGIIHGYLTFRMDWPEKVSGYVAEFLHYYRQTREKTATDRKTFALCQRFREEWGKYGGPRYRVRKRTHAE